MFATVIVGLHLASVLPTIPEVATATGGRILNLDVVPQGRDMPACIHSATGSSYGEASIGGTATDETLDYQVSIVCEGQSIEPIWEAAHAQMVAIDGSRADVSVDGVPYWLGFEAVGEVVPTTEFDGNTYYRRLGTVYRVHVVRG